MTDYRVQLGDEVKSLSETKLRKKLRANELSGLQLVKIPGEEQWQPLHSIQLFADEVPFHGASQDTARRRHLRSFGGHFVAFATTFFIVSTFLGVGGSWLWIWGIFVAIHGFKVVPTALALAGEGKLLQQLSPAGDRALSNAPEPGPNPPELTEPKPSPPPESSPDIRQLRELLGSYTEGNDDPLLQKFETLARNLERIQREEAELRAELEGSRVEQLEARRAQLKAQLLGPDTDDRGPHTRTLLTDELGAVEARLAALGSAHSALDALISQRRIAEDRLAELHLQVQRLRIEGQTRGLGLGEQVDDLRIELQSRAEAEALVASDKKQER